MRTSYMLCSVILGALLATPAARADLSQISFGTTTSHGNTVSATFTLDWNGSDLMVSVANSSPDHSVITGWALMGGSTGTGFSAQGTLNNSAWYQANRLSMSPTNQFGTFDFGADSGPSGLNSGNPNAGVLAGTTATFTFYNLVSSAGSAMDFLDTLNRNGLAIAARWQRVGLDGEDSAKAGGAGGERFVVVPSPDSTILASLGLTVASLWRRRWL